MSDKTLKDAGLKITTPRIKIFDILSKSEQKHLSAEDIYKNLQDSSQNVSLATIYRVLSQFEVAGIVHKHQFEGEHAVYELSSEEHHDHIICTKCNKVIEFYDQEIEERQEQIVKKFDFKMTTHSLYIFGTCKDCLSQSSGLN